MNEIDEEQLQQYLREIERKREQLEQQELQPEPVQQQFERRDSYRGFSPYRPVTREQSMARYRPVYPPFARGNQTRRPFFKPIFASMGRRVVRYQDEETK